MILLSGIVFHVGRFSKALNNDKGTTRVLVYTAKAKQIFNEIKFNFVYVEVAPEAIIEGIQEMRESVQSNEKEIHFFKMLLKWMGCNYLKNIFPKHFV